MSNGKECPIFSEIEEMEQFEAQAERQLREIDSQKYWEERGNDFADDRDIKKPGKEEDYFDDPHFYNKGGAYG